MGLNIRYSMRNDLSGSNVQLIPSSTGSGYRNNKNNNLDASIVSAYMINQTSATASNSQLGMASANNYGADIPPSGGTNHSQAVAHKRLNSSISRYGSSAKSKGAT